MPCIINEKTLPSKRKREKKSKQISNKMAESPVDFFDDNLDKVIINFIPDNLVELINGGNPS